MFAVAAPIRVRYGVFVGEFHQVTSEHFLVAYLLPAIFLRFYFPTLLCPSSHLVFHFAPIEVFLLNSWSVLEKFSVVKGFMILDKRGFTQSHLFFAVCFHQMSQLGYLHDLLSPLRYDSHHRYVLSTVRRKITSTTWDEKRYIHQVYVRTSWQLSSSNFLTFSNNSFFSVDASL